MLGIIKPTLVIRWGTIKRRGRVLLVYGLSIFAFMVMIGVTAPALTPEQQAKAVVKKQETVKTQEVVTAKSKQSQEEFDAFYQDLKKYHTFLDKDLSDLKMALDKTSKGTINSVDFYTYLKSLQNVFLLAWSDIDKKTAPNGLNDAQKKEIDEFIKFLSLLALSVKEAVEALMEGMNNPNSMKAIRRCWGISIRFLAEMKVRSRYSSRNSTRRNSSRSASSMQKAMINGIQKKTIIRCILLRVRTVWSGIGCFAAGPPVFALGQGLAVFGF